MSIGTANSLEQLLKGVQFTTALSPLKNIKGLVSDSRQVTQGDVFVCISESEAERRQHSSAALKAGAAAVMLDADEVSKVGAKIVAIQQLRPQLSRIAANFYGLPSARQSIVAVTGTNGKSTVCSWIEQLAQFGGKTAGSIGTLGVHVDGKLLVEPDGMTTRDAIRTQEILALCETSGAEIMAMEVSSHGMDQYRVEAVCFAVAVFTNFTRDHLDYHGTELEYWQAKKRLFELPGIRAAVINVDDQRGQALALELSSKLPVLRFSAEGSELADIRLSNLRYEKGYRAKLESKSGAHDIYLPQMTAEFELSNLLASLGACSALGFSLESLIPQLSELKTADGRLQLAGQFNGASVYVDYAHTPDAVTRVLSALRRNKSRHLIAVLGCGGDRDRGKRPEMTKAALQIADRLVITSDNPRSEDQSQIEADMLRGVEDRSRIECIADRRQAIRFAIEHAQKDSCVAVLGKGHERFQIIGTKKEYFSDVEVVAKSISEIQSKPAAARGGVA